jgi:hypothetical protein
MGALVTVEKKKIVFHWEGIRSWCSDKILPQIIIYNSTNIFETINTRKILKKLKSKDAHETWAVKSVAGTHKDKHKCL